MIESYAKWWSIDLHVHTPGSRDAAAVDFGSPADIVRAALDAGLDAIAVTDHNTADWCDSIAEAAQGSGLVVLPGVEVTTPQGHLLGVWEENTPSTHIRDLLIRLGFATASMGNLEGSTQCSMLEACEEISQSNGLAIAAHIDKERGLLSDKIIGSLTNQILLSRDLHALEIVHLDSKKSVSDRRLGRNFTFTQGSDCYSKELSRHHISGIGLRRTWIKASRPNLAGLRHALDDPDLRVRLKAPKPITHPRIESVSILGKFLHGEQFELSPDMNCLVGGTGAGKSLAFECIRYVLGQQCDEGAFPVIATDVQSRLSFGLGASATVTAVVASDDSRYRITRAYAEGPLDVVVEKIVEGDFKALPVSPREVISISAFSQGEILEYARQPVGRMALVDGGIDLEKVNTAIQVCCEKFRTNSSEILDLQTKMAAKEALAQALAQKRDQLDSLSKFFDDEDVASQDQWTSEKGVVQAVRDAVSLHPLNLPRVEVFECPEDSRLKAIRDAVKHYNEESVKYSKEVSERLAVLRVPVMEALAEWESSYRTYLTDFDAKLKETDSAASLTQLKQRLAVLQESVLEAQAAQACIEKELAPKMLQLQSDRNELGIELARLRAERRDLRRARAKELNRELSGKIRLDVPDGGDRSDFRARLEDLRKGSFLRESSVQKIAENLSPSKFSRLMRLEGFAELEESCPGVTAVDFGKLHQNILAKWGASALLELELLECPDTLSVKMNRGVGEGYGHIEQLSPGQKCTAILLLLMADGESPILVDQPEDAIHAPWIEDYLVSKLREDRGKRQYFFATHSAGLVVSADSEQLITMVASAGSGRIEASGGIERHDLNLLALRHLEGGPLPFNRRTRKFHPALGEN